MRGVSRVCVKRSDKSVNLSLETESPLGTRAVSSESFDTTGTNLSTPVTTGYFYCIMQPRKGIATVLYCMQLTNTTKPESPRRTGVLGLLH